MKQTDLTNPKQKEILAQFYSNFGLVILTVGVITPLFTGIGNVLYFLLKVISSLILAAIILKVALEFLIKMSTNTDTAYWLMLIFVSLFIMFSHYWFFKRK